jgi:hypothetical protein
MKSISGRAEGACRASVPAVAELLRAVDRYSEWHPEGVRRIVVLERDGAGDPVILEVTLRAAIGPIARDVELRLEVSAAQANRVTLTRLPNEPEDPERFVATWHLDRAGTAETTIRLELEADLDLPRLAPVGELANNLARAFVAAAITAIESQDAGSSPPCERRNRYIRSVS